MSVCTCAGYFIGRWLDFGANAADADTPTFQSIRRKAHRQFIGFLATIVLFHITVGLVRALESLDQIVHSLSAYTQLLTTPEALFLVLTGSCLSVLAYHKGLSAFDDPYPGYGERGRAVQFLLDDIADLYENLSSHITDEFERTFEDLEDTAKDSKKAVDHYNKAVQSCHTSRRELEQQVNAAESQMRAEVAQIVNHHRAVRQHNDQAMPEADFCNLVSFQDYLAIELPAFRHTSEKIDLGTELLEARAMALKRLSDFFHHATESYSSGEKP